MAARGKLELMSERDGKGNGGKGATYHTTCMSPLLVDHWPDIGCHVQSNEEPTADTALVNSLVDTSVTQSACGLSMPSQDVAHASSTPPPEFIDASSSPSLDDQLVEFVDHAAIEIDNADAGRDFTSLNKAVLDTLPVVVHSGPCDTSDLMNATKEDVL
ncbi:hypothetical protein V6N12_060544 [Hibiscus sabdariffa]|uniref:Uncharacterized protein n=1 Tax=Hibiscus sabdariffa TaxID=183260 RepID=A0ABR2D4T7_9ROSI